MAITILMPIIHNIIDNDNNKADIAMAMALAMVSQKQLNFRSCKRCRSFPGLVVSRVVMNKITWPLQPTGFNYKTN